MPKIQEVTNQLLEFIHHPALSADLIEELVEVF